MSHGDKPEDFLLLRSPHDSKIMNGALGPSSPEGTKGSSGASTVVGWLLIINIRIAYYYSLMDYMVAEPEIIMLIYSCLAAFSISYE